MPDSFGGGVKSFPLFQTLPAKERGRLAYVTSRVAFDVEVQPAEHSEGAFSGFTVAVPSENQIRLAGLWVFCHNPKVVVLVRRHLPPPRTPIRTRPVLSATALHDLGVQEPPDDHNPDAYDHQRVGEELGIDYATHAYPLRLAATSRAMPL